MSTPDRPSGRSNSPGGDPKSLPDKAADDPHGEKTKQSTTDDAGSLKGDADAVPHILTTPSAPDEDDTPSSSRPAPHACGEARRSTLNPNDVTASAGPSHTLSTPTASEVSGGGDGSRSPNTLKSPTQLDALSASGDGPPSRSRSPNPFRSPVQFDTGAAGPLTDDDDADSPSRARARMRRLTVGEQLLAPTAGVDDDGDGDGAAPAAPTISLRRATVAAGLEGTPKNKGNPAYMLGAEGATSDGLIGRLRRRSFGESPRGGRRRGSSIIRARARRLSSTSDRSDRSDRSGDQPTSVSNDMPNDSDSDKSDDDPVREPAQPVATGRAAVVALRALRLADKSPSMWAIDPSVLSSGHQTRRESFSNSHDSSAPTPAAAAAAAAAAGLPVDPFAMWPLEESVDLRENSLRGGRTGGPFRRDSLARSSRRPSALVTSSAEKTSPAVQGRADSDGMPTGSMRSLRRNSSLRGDGSTPSHGDAPSLGQGALFINANSSTMSPGMTSTLSFRGGNTSTSMRPAGFASMLSPAASLHRGVAPRSTSSPGLSAFGSPPHIDINQLNTGGRDGTDSRASCMTEFGYPIEAVAGGQIDPPLPGGTGATSTGYPGICAVVPGVLYLGSRRSVFAAFPRSASPSRPSSYQHRASTTTLDSRRPSMFTSSEQPSSTGTAYTNTPLSPTPMHNGEPLPSPNAILNRRDSVEPQSSLTPAGSTTASPPPPPVPQPQHQPPLPAQRDFLAAGGGFLCVAKECAAQPFPRGATDNCCLLPLVDNGTTVLLDHIAAVFAFILENAQNGRPTMLYCLKGRSRSVSFALAFLMWQWRLNDVETALALLRRAYRDAEPNAFFLMQLSNVTLADLDRCAGQAMGAIAGEMPELPPANERAGMSDEDLDPKEDTDDLASVPSMAPSGDAVKSQSEEVPTPLLPVRRVDQRADDAAADTSPASRGSSPRSAAAGRAAGSPQSSVASANPPGSAGPAAGHSSGHSARHLSGEVDDRAPSSSAATATFVLPATDEQRRRAEERSRDPSGGAAPSELSSPLHSPKAAAAAGKKGGRGGPTAHPFSPGPIAMSVTAPTPGTWSLREAGGMTAPFGSSPATDLQMPN